MSAEVRSGGGPEMRSPTNKGKRRRDFHENEWIEISVKGEMRFEKKNKVGGLTVSYILYSASNKTVWYCHKE